jgi:hypothetical protein
MDSVGLRLVMRHEARQLSPARVAAKLDEACAEHDAHDEPAKEPNHDGGGADPRGRHRFIGHKNTASMPGLEELGSPIRSPRRSARPRRSRAARSRAQHDARDGLRRA